MTDVEIKTSDLEEMDDIALLDEENLSFPPGLPTSDELAKVNEVLDTTLSANELSTDLLQIFLRDVAKFRLLTAEEEIALAKMRPDRIDEKTGEVLRRPEPLTVQEQRLVSSPDIRVRTSEQAAEALVNHNLRMVITVANRYHRGKGIQGIGYLDLIQEGMLGLMRAVELYDYHKKGKNGKSYRFSTYAMWWIRQAVARGLAEKSRNIRVPMHVIEKLSKLSAAEKELHSELGREPTVAELSDRAEMKPNNVSEILRGTAVPISLSKKESAGRGDEVSDESEFGSVLEDATTPSPHDIVSGQIDSQVLAATLSKLHPRTLDIIQKRFGLNGEVETSLTEIGKEWGITYQRVRQIELDILAKLRGNADLQILRDN